jgi:hypothetical protein
MVCDLSMTVLPSGFCTSHSIGNALPISRDDSGEASTHLY